ncbi:UNKNOWN [Stylonychia lemnae]|uniref:Uncharacterized protein n=1 Tax=Stylonychia lemnae TaxID=5949 RepID=A0A078AB11_STYLE|nr:UNKNOWN [Stylonychia lemnae]|eukprot:CDW79056.1 UNKNOWN [Stylonychia lemnae]
MTQFAKSYNTSSLPNFRYATSEDLFEMARSNRPQPVQQEKPSSLIQSTGQLPQVQHGAVIPTNKNLYYQMKHQLGMVHSPGSISDQAQIKTQVFKLNKIYKDSDNLTNDNKLSLSQNNFFARGKPTGSLIGNDLRRSMGSFTGNIESDRSNTLQNDHPHFRLFKDGLTKVTLGNSQVRFGKKVYLNTNTPQCSYSRIPIPGNTNPHGLDMDRDNFKLMPAKKRLSPLRTPQEDLMIIDTDNNNFNPKSHTNYFNDFFGFKDKGKRQINEDFPIKMKMDREYNIINNDINNENLQKKQDATFFKEKKVQLNTENRYFIPPKIESIRNSVERATNFHQQNKADKKYLQKIENTNFAGQSTQIANFKQFRSINPQTWT